MLIFLNKFYIMKSLNQGGHRK